MDELSKKRFRSALESAIFTLEESAKCYRYQDEPEYKDLMEHMIRTKASLIERPYFVGVGWWPIIDKYAEQARKIDPTCEVEVKEKYGTLRADIMTENDDIRGALYQIQHEMERAIEGVCEVCGAPGSIVKEGGWLKTLCKDCAAMDDAERREEEEEMEERYYSELAAQSLFGILPPDVKEK